jgi:hypothetical protein
MWTATQIKEYLNKTGLKALKEHCTEGFSTEFGALFDTELVDTASSYYKHSMKWVHYTHKLNGQDVYFTVVGLSDYDNGVELDSWYFVEPITITKTIYKPSEKLTNRLLAND